MRFFLSAVVLIAVGGQVADAQVLKFRLRSRDNCASGVCATVQAAPSAKPVPPAVLPTPKPSAPATAPQSVPTAVRVTTRAKPAVTVGKDVARRLAKVFGKLRPHRASIRIVAH